jgi:hypothetical protein
MVETYVITEFYLPKAAALLSMIGSSVIMGEVYQDHVTAASGRKLPAVSQILLSMSFGDLWFGLAFLLGTWVAPEDPPNSYLQGTNHGTDGTCAFQGFILQFGYMASLLFSASLAVVYLLQTRYQWRPERLLVGHKLLVTIIVLWTVCLLSAVIPLCLDMYHWAGPLCWITAPSAEDCLLTDEVETIECQEGRDVTFFVFSLQVIPVWLCIILDSIIMTMIYRTARSLERKAQQSHDKHQGHRDTNVDSTTGNPSGDVSERILEDPGMVNVDQTQHTSSTRAPPLDDVEGQQSTTGVSRTSTKLSTRSSHSRKRSRIVATQGMWYITGFFLTYGLATISIIVFITGGWNPQLDRASYFFLALQGLWNFLIFSRGRKKMKTRIGAALKRWTWDTSCCFCWSRPCPFMHWFLPPSSPSTSPESLVGALPTQQLDDQNLVTSHVHKHKHNSHKSQTAQHQCNHTQKSSVNNLTLAPIDENEVAQFDLEPDMTRDEGKGSEHSLRKGGIVKKISGFWIAAKSTLVSELGASEISSGSSNDDCSSSHSSADDERPSDKPPSTPARATSDRDIMHSAPPIKPLRLVSNKAIGVKESGPPSKPIRFVSEVSICEKEELDERPAKPVRFVSERSGLCGFDNDTHQNDDFAPSKPIRFESEASVVEHEDYPTRRIRVASEGPSDNSLCATHPEQRMPQAGTYLEVGNPPPWGECNTRGSAAGEKAPSRPVRVVSEIDPIRDDS